MGKSSIRQAATAALVAIAAFSMQPISAASAATPPQTEATTQSEDVTPIWFGNGCFWGRQKDFVDAEKSVGRKGENISAVVGYAGGPKKAKRVCYYTGLPGSVYEDLGHAEVVKVDLTGGREAAEEQMARFASTYFSQFKKTAKGMQRSDPQDAGPAYRNVVGIPGGVNSPLYKILQEKNINRMQLVEGTGNVYQRGKPSEDDKVNVVYIMDSEKMSFNLAETYHQFHNGIGKPFPSDYTRGQKQIAKKSGRIFSTGCPDLPF